MDKHRFFSKLYFVLLTCLLILPCSKDVSGAEWKPYGTVERGVLSFYDAQSIIYLANNSVRVFVKQIPEDEQSRVREIASMRKKIPTFPDNWSFSEYLYQINCSDRTGKVLKATLYDTKNEIIESTTAEQPFSITPETMEEGLYKAVCVKKD